MGEPRLRPVGRREVDGGAAAGVASQRRIVLQPVAGAVLVHRHAAQVRLRVRRRQRGAQVNARGQHLERVVRLLGRDAVSALRRASDRLHRKAGQRTVEHGAGAEAEPRCQERAQCQQALTWAEGASAPAIRSMARDQQ